MAKFELQIQANTWAYCVIDAETEDEAREWAKNNPLDSIWRFDTDWANTGELEVYELDAEGSRKG